MILQLRSMSVKNLMIVLPGLLRTRGLLGSGSSDPYYYVLAST